MKTLFLFCLFLPFLVEGFLSTSFLNQKRFELWSSEEEEQWWFNSKIHKFGNVGIGGRFHAFVAPFVTKLIDIRAYGGVDIRSEISLYLREIIQREDPVVVDFACGTGTSTRPLGKAFSGGQVHGLDASKEMIHVAKRTDGTSSSSPSYAVCNVATEEVKTHFSCVDLITVMFLFHESPPQGHEAILNNVHDLLRPGGVCCIVDISTDYDPSPAMLLGEPFIVDYIKTLEETIQRFVKSGHFEEVSTSGLFENVIPGHVVMSLLRKK